MGTVSNPAAMSSLKAVVGGPANLAAYNRGGSWIPSSAPATISATVVGLALKQFNGYSTGAALSASASPASLSSSSSGSTVSKSFTTGVTTVTPSGGNGTYTHSWSLVSWSGGFTAAPTINVSGASASVTGNVNDSSGSGTDGLATIRDTVTSGGSSVNVNISVDMYYSWISCIVTRSFMSSGRRASTVREGQQLRVTDPQLLTANSTDAVVRRAEKHTVQCVRIIAANGAWLECSTTAPIPVKDGSLVLAPHLMGLQIATAYRPDDTADHIEVEWSEVVTVKPIGRRRVQLIFVDHRCFWASGDGRRFILHHNQKPISIP